MEPGFIDEINKMDKEDLRKIVFHCIGLYNKHIGEKLPFVYCPLCGEEIKKPENELRLSE